MVGKVRDGKNKILEKRKVCLHWDRDRSGLSSTLNPFFLDNSPLFLQWRLVRAFVSHTPSSCPKGRSQKVCGITFALFRCFFGTWGGRVWSRSATGSVTGSVAAEINFINFSQALTRTRDVILQVLAGEWEYHGERSSERKAARVRS